MPLWLEILILLAIGVAILAGRAGYARRRLKALRSDRADRLRHRRGRQR
jgi:hypothetical protein